MFGLNSRRRLKRLWHGPFSKIIFWVRLSVFVVACILLSDIGAPVWVLKWTNPKISLKFPPSISPAHENEGIITNSALSRFAYVQYTTNYEYLCNSLMVFDSLKRLQSPVSRVLLYPHGWDANPTLLSLVLKAQDVYGATVKPIERISYGAGSRTWSDSFTKLLVFNQTEYDRVVYFDSDGTVLHPLDELFLLDLPSSTPVAMPRAYWLSPDLPPTLSSQIMLLRPSVSEFTKIMKYTHEVVQHPRGLITDMDILTELYRDTAVILPHRPWNLLSGAFRNIDTRQAYLGDDDVWDPEAVINETKYVHFSDWPYPKPWHPKSGNLPTADKPCVYGDCRDQEIWLWLYRNFQERRTEVCRR